MYKAFPKLQQVTKLGPKFLTSVLPVPLQETLFKTWMRKLRHLEEIASPEMLHLIATFNTTASLAHYLANKTTYNHTIIYEDFMNNVRGETEKLFAVMELDKEWMGEALKAIDMGDSQRGLLGGRGNQSIELTPKQCQEIESFFQDLLPELSWDMSLDDFRKLVYQ